MPTIEEIKARHAKELAEAERIEAIRAQLPIKPDQARVMVFSGHAHAYYNADCLGDALSILRSFEPVPFLQVRGTFLSHKPRAWFKPADLERANEEIESRGVLLTVSGGKGFGPKAELKQWAQLDTGEVIQVQVSLELPPYGKGFPHKWRVASNVSYDRNGEILSAEHRPPTICADLPVIRWAAGSRDAYQFSWVWLERGTFDNEMARFVEVTP